MASLEAQQPMLFLNNSFLRMSEFNETYQSSNKTKFIRMLSEYFDFNALNAYFFID